VVRKGCRGKNHLLSLVNKSRFREPDKGHGRRTMIFEEAATLSKKGKEKRAMVRR